MVSTGSFGELVKHFTTRTSMHGWSKVSENGSVFRKVIWVMLTLTCMGLAIDHVAKIVILYRNWPVSTLVSIENKNRLNFPAVTICNMNPARRTVLKNKAEDLGYEELVNMINEADERRRMDEADEETEENVENEEDKYERLTNAFRIESEFSSVMGKMNESERQQIGHQLHEMMIRCSHEGRPCNSRNFTTFYNYKYGNCFTFNGNPKQKLETRKPGPRYGLTLELDISENEYSEFLADTLGAKVLVHDPGTMPFPEDDGVSISPGMATSIGISKVVLKRTGPPHGECMYYSKKKNEEVNVYADTNDVSYTKKACMKTCYQKHLITDCQCCDSDFPCRGRAVRHARKAHNDDVVRRCNETDVNDKRCVKDLLLRFEMDKLNCTAECRPACHEVVFNTDVSSGKWPSSPLIHRVINKVRLKRGNQSHAHFSSMEDQDDKLDFLNRNVLKIEVYYKQLNFEKIETTPAYNWSSLISDLGGQAGLWLGFSILTAMELLELLIDMVKLVGQKLTSSAASNKTTDSTLVENIKL